MEAASSKRSFLQHSSQKILNEKINFKLLGITNVAFLWRQKWSRESRLEKFPRKVNRGQVQLQDELIVFWKITFQVVTQIIQFHSQAIHDKLRNKEIGQKDSEILFRFPFKEKVTLNPLLRDFSDLILL